MNAQDRRYEDISIGEMYAFERTITTEDVRRFGQWSGDTTVLSINKRPVIHGMMAAGFFSTLIDLYGPGPQSIYVRQTLEFRKPIYEGDHLRIQAVVIDKSDGLRLITLTTAIVRGAEVLVAGEAKIRL